MRRSLIPLTTAFLVITAVRGDVRIDPHFGSSIGSTGADANKSGRYLSVPSPETMDEAADLIINGKVKAVQDSMKTVVSSYQDPSPPAPPEHIMHAFVEVLHTFKGMTDEDQIDFRFPVTAPNYQATNGPSHIALKKDHRYRFFLKKDESGSGYVCALNGKIDDEYAVQALGPDEADDQPYLKTKDALAMARALYATVQPPPVADLGLISGDCHDPLHEGGARWFIYFYASVPDPNRGPFTVAIGNGKATIYNPATDH